MGIRILNIWNALNPAFRKVKPTRTEINIFKANLIKLLDRIHDSESESEEFHKNLVSEFLKTTYYKGNHFINTKGRNDLVIPIKNQIAAIIHGQQNMLAIAAAWSASKASSSFTR